VIAFKIFFRRCMCLFIFTLTSYNPYYYGHLRRRKLFQMSKDSQLSHCKLKCELSVQRWWLYLTRFTTSIKVKVSTSVYKCLQVSTLSTSVYIVYTCLQVSTLSTSVYKCLQVSISVYTYLHCLQVSTLSTSVYLVYKCLHCLHCL